MKKKKKGFFGQFREFIMRGNVLDMAVGVIVATAFGKITTSLVNDVLMPFIGWLIGDFDLSQLNITLSPAVIDASGAVIKDAVTIGIGTLLVTVIDFLIVAFVVFCLIKAMNTAKDFAESKLKKKEEEKVEEAKGPTTEELLAQILAELKKDGAK
jgi:large conductance mechanosensitive channel